MELLSLHVESKDEILPLAVNSRTARGSPSRPWPGLKEVEGRKSQFDFQDLLHLSGTQLERLLLCRVSSEWSVLIGSWLDMLCDLFARSGQLVVGHGLSFLPAN